MDTNSIRSALENAGLVQPMTASKSGIRATDVANAPEPNVVSGKAPKAKAGKVKPAPLDALVAHIGRDRAEACEDFRTMVLERAEDAETYAVLAVAIATAIFPSFPTGKAGWQAWKAVAAFMRDQGSKFAADCLRTAMRDLYGKLPTAGKARNGGGGTKGVSAKRAADAFHTATVTLCERAAKLPKRDINAALLTKVRTFIEQARALDRELAKAVNE